MKKLDSKLQATRPTRFAARKGFTPLEVGKFLIFIQSQRKLVQSYLWAGFSKKTLMGFTLIELLIVLAMLVIVGALSIPFARSFQVSSDLQTHAATVQQTLRRAREYALTGTNGADQGVFFNTAENSLTFYQGSSFASRDPSFDQDFGFPEVISMVTDFGDDVSFAAFSGRPSVLGTVILSSAVSDDNVSISINELGIIQ